MSVKEPWTGRVEPFRIFGNLYFAGTIPASCHLIDTGDGLILIDTGYPQNFYLVIESIWELGFRPADVRYIVHSHGHYDHMGATRSLVELTGARNFIGAADRDFVTWDNPLNWANELGFEFTEAFEPDVLLNDGDVISLGTHLSDASPRQDIPLVRPPSFSTSRKMAANSGRGCTAA